jgi:hypothetical protein
MTQFLLKHYRSIVSFFLLLLAIWLHAFASPTPTCPIVTERFQGLADGTVSNNSATGWYIDASNVAAGYFAVKSNRFHAQEIGGEGRWYSKVFSVAGYTDVQVAVKITAEGDMNSSEYVKIYYKVNGGAETLYDSRTGNFGTIDFISPVLNGNNVQIIVKLYNYNNGGSQTSKYYIEEYRVFKEHGPCAGSIPVSATAGNGGILTCTNPSLTLSASTTASGTTTWSWSGPNSFSSTLQNPSVSVAGTYTVVGSNAAGSGSATVIVSENKTPPVVTATGGNLACASSIVIGATSSISGSAYSWTGPGGFTSNLQNTSVSAAGTYTVTVTNPANGCTASQSVTVTAGAATPSTLWNENFTVANNTTASGTWSSITPGGVFSVQSNEFRVNNTGTGGEGVWTSGSISIAGKSSITISAGVRSGVSSGGGLENNGSSLDYVRFYYKLNNGAETLFSQHLGTINSNSTTNTAVAVGSLAGTTLEIIIRARTTTSDEFYYFDNVSVTGINSAATITPSVTGTVTCTNAAQLSAAVSGGTVSSYSWTGPNGFTSSLQNPLVTAGGQYIVTATLSSGGCSVSAPITVPENKTTPDITATGGSLACFSGIALNVSSSVPGSTYSWTGPGGFTSTAANPVVNTAGTYTATVTDPANGCTASQQVSVTASSLSWVENFSLTNGTTVDNGSTPWSITVSPSSTLFSVLNNEFRISNSTTTGEGVWTSGAINIAGMNSVSVSVNVRSAVSGSGAMNSSGEYGDYIRFYYKLNNGAEVLFAQKTGAIESHSTTSSVVSINALAGDNLRIVVRARATGNDEFYYFDNVQVTGNAQSTVNAVATAGNMLTCANTNTTLTGSSTVPGAQYSWIGPGGFSSSLQNPTVNVAGTYTLTVASPSTGCTGTDTALVISNTTQPDATAGVNGGLSCSVSSVTLTGSSGVPGVSYNWSGPNGFTSALQNPSATVAGTYILTVTNPVNGCANTHSVVVTFSNTTTGVFWNEDFSLANGTAVDNGATAWSTTINPSSTLFSVLNNEFRVSNSSTTGEGVWTSGVISIAGKTNISISAKVKSSITNNAQMNTTGEFADYIRFYYKLNGSATEVLFAERLGAIENHSTTPVSLSVNSLSGNELRIVVRARATGNDEFYYVDDIQVTGTSQGNVTAAAAAGNPLTCINTTTMLTGSTTASGAVYSWTGPDGFNSSSQNPIVNKAGIYTLTVTAGGCSATDTAMVLEDVAPPANVTTSSTSGGFQLTCLVGGLTLTGSSSTAGVMYTWTLPNGVVGAGSATSATQEGSYIFTARNPANGCTATDTFVVVRNMSTPMDASITGGNQWLTCINTSATLTASNNLPGVVFNWIGPNGFTAPGPVAAVSQPGYYNVIMTHPVTGCNHSIGAAVFRDTTSPANLAIAISSANTQITCTNNNVQLSASSSTPGTTYEWTGPGNYTSLVPVISINEAGEYTLVGTNPATGCEVVTTRIIAENKVAPANVTATAVTNSGQLTCTVTNISLAGGSSTAGVSYEWTAPGFSAPTQHTSVNTAGTYTLTVTDPSNGCNASASAIVTANNTPPAGVSATFSDILTCLTTIVDLTGTSTTPGVTYQWSSASGFSSPNRITQTSVPGTYQLRVTDPANGCVRTVFTTVLQDKTPPADVSAENTGPLTCTETSVLLIANTSAADVDYLWTGPNGFVSFLSMPTVSEPGEYTLIVTDLATNGCSDTVTTIVETTCGAKGPRTTNTTPVVADPSEKTLPAKFEYKAYPNPFNERTLIEFQSPVSDFVRVELYNSNGAMVKVLFNDHVGAGRTYKIGMEGNRLSQGIYYYMIKTSGKKVFSGKLLLIK